MVSTPRTPRKPRDYALERERRNIRARSLGFSSLDQLAKARRRGEFPSAKAIRTDDAAKARAAEITAQRKARPSKSLIDAGELAMITRKSQDWSDKHSQQDATKFNKRWSAQRRMDYYRAFVQWWRLPDDERNFDPTYYYMNKYGGFSVPTHDNPYK